MHLGPAAHRAADAEQPGLGLLGDRAAAADAVDVDAPGAGHRLGRALDRVQVDPVDGLLDGPQVGGADDLDDPLLERRPGIALRLYELAAPRPQDLFVVISNSGVNSVVVEMALHAKERGHRLLAITSRAHTAALPAVHPSGKKLADLADVAFDNAAPPGDALLPLPGGGAVCALSTLTGALLVRMTVAEAAAQLLASGDRPPVYVCANVPGGFEGNPELERRYVGRIRRTAG
ncbi:sugar isomerase domain-containing protein [Streptomyces sp. NPDC060053]|uniref:sugar isomerase domain-containing protein n=1 Tax=Streptomyces sp. NPDC060053 TaxID=3347047 RepID=UPI0036CCCA95